MLYHNNCDGQVFLDNNTLRILSEFNITQKGIRPTLSEIVKIDGENSIVQFICSKCNNIVKHGDIRGHCFNCGRSFELKDLYKVVKHSGFYCMDCCVEHIGEELTRKPIVGLLKFYTGTGGSNE
jgi:hypothetical protein